MAEQASTGAGAGGHGGKARRWRRIILGTVVVVLILLLVASLVNVSEYAVTPGAALPVSAVLTPPAGRGHHVAEPVLYTYVEITQLRLIDYLTLWLHHHEQLVSQQDLVGPGVPASELVAQGALEMESAEQAANVAALRELGYSVPGRDVGAVIAAVLRGTPASGALRVGEVLTSIDGHPTLTPAAAVTAIQSLRPGQSATLTVSPYPWPQHPPASKTVHVVLSSAHVDGRDVAFLGVELDRNPARSFDLPFTVAINPNNVGGPSAGLAFTLGILDTLSSGDLTGHAKVAATGTMDAQGEVGPVGGVAEKAVAITRAGASVFLVPPQEYKKARANVGPHVHVMAVSTLAQALVDLRALRCPKKPSSCPLIPGASLAGGMAG